MAHDEKAETEVEEGTFMRPYLLTGGRTRSEAGELAVEAMVAVSAGSTAPDDHDLAAIYALCKTPNSISEISAKCAMPLGVARVLVADLWGNRWFDPDSGARTMLTLPAGVTASSSLAAQGDTLALASIWPFGLLYVIDTQANKVIKTAKFESPYSPVFMLDGSLLVADYGAGTVTRLAPGKSRDKTVVASDLQGPLGLALDGEQHLYISEYDTGRLAQLDLESGTVVTIAAGLQQPEGLAMTGDGHVLVAETGTRRLLSIDPATGVMQVIAENLAIGLAGGTDLPKPFLPTGIAVDAADNIYVSADVDNAIYKLTLMMQ